MVWLVHQMFRGLKIGIRAVFIGPPSFRRQEKRPPAAVDSIPHGDRPPFQRFAYGAMLIRVWRNWNKRSELYYNIDIVRDVGKGRTAKSFRPDDLDDVERCIWKVRAWLRDGN
jgi:hypothetical protein